MFLLRAIGVLSVALLIGGCATPMRISLTPEQRAKITDIKAHVVVVQDEVIAAVAPSGVGAATGGGLIGAAIDSTITNNRVKESQQILGPFYATIEDVDYRKEFYAAIERELGSYSIKVSQFTATPRAFNNAELADMRMQLPPGQALLVVYPRYFLTMDFRTLDSETIVSLWSKEGASESTALPTPIQRGVLYYQSSPVGTGKKDSMALWGAQNAALFRRTLRESIAETIKLIQIDTALAPDATKQNDPKSFSFNTGAQQGEIKGQQVKETNDRIVVLGSDNKLYSLPKTSNNTTVASGQ